MTTTMSLIARQTVGSAGAATVTFSNIPQTFTDIKVVMSTRNSSSGNYFDIQVNGSGSNLSNRRLYSNSSTVASYTGSDLIVYSDYSSRTANTFDSIEMYIPNYTSSNYKSITIDNVTENNATSAEMALTAGLWSSTSAITSLGFVSSTGSFVEFTEFSLYGISSSSTQNTSVPLASGGDVITTDGTYWYHTFLYSGTFTPLKALTCDYLVVAGGGGGGNGYSGVNNAGGAGAGGFKTSVGGSALSLSSNTAYQATIGAGGVAGTNGSNSIFSAITSTGGGAGGQNLSGAIGNGSNGGSGGGGTAAGSGAGTGGTGNAGEGFAGGAGQSSGGYYAGGGGGAGEVGNTDGAGYGGDGLSSSLSGTSVTYAGGGSGSTNSSTVPGGDGGGGTGGSLGGTGTAGTANRGGGGGGGSGAAGGNGGSGIIVLRYPVL
jgi:hypothetical protein